MKRNIRWICLGVALASGVFAVHWAFEQNWMAFKFNGGLFVLSLVAVWVIKV